MKACSIVGILKTKDFDAISSILPTTTAKRLISTLKALENNKLKISKRKRKSTSVEQITKIIEASEDFIDKRAFGVKQVPTLNGIVTIPCIQRNTSILSAFKVYQQKTEHAVSLSTYQKVMKKITKGQRTQLRCLDDIKETEGRLNFENIRTLIKETKSLQLISQKVTNLCRIYSHRAFLFCSTIRSR